MKITLIICFLAIIIVAATKTRKQKYHKRKEGDKVIEKIMKLIDLYLYINDSVQTGDDIREEKVVSNEKKTSNSGTFWFVPKPEGDKSYDPEVDSGYDKDYPVTTIPPRRTTTNRKTTLRRHSTTRYRRRTHLRPIDKDESYDQEIDSGYDKDYRVTTIPPRRTTTKKKRSTTIRRHSTTSYRRRTRLTTVTDAWEITGGTHPATTTVIPETTIRPADTTFSSSTWKYANWFTLRLKTTTVVHKTTTTIPHWHTQTFRTRSTTRCYAYGIKTCPPYVWPGYTSSGPQINLAGWVEGENPSHDHHDDVFIKG